MAFIFFVTELLDTHMSHTSMYTQLRGVVLTGTEWEHEAEGSLALKEALENIHFMVRLPPIAMGPLIGPPGRSFT